MPPKPRRQRFTQPRRRSAMRTDAGSASADAPMNDQLPSRGSPQLQTPTEGIDVHVAPAVQRRRFYAMLAWRTDFAAILELEASTSIPAVDELVGISGYARRQLRKGGTAAEQLAQRISFRQNDIAGYIQRSRNVHAVPWSQAMRGISFLNDQIRTATWEQERKGRRVVSRLYAIWMLQEMADCRPPPAFDVHDGIKSIGFDQTYVRGPGACALERSVMPC
jgi:hypothetical protein